MRRSTHAAGFSLVELCIAIGVLMIVGLVVHSILISSTTLLAKNVSLNGSSLILRSALDRVYSEINQANGLPKLINSDGSAVTGNGPASGVIFDRYLGGPYIVTNPGSGLASSVTTFQIKRSTDGLASPPVPTLNDVICVNNGAIRPLVSSCSAGTVAGDGTQPLSVTLKAALGATITWSANTQQVAHVVHREAFVVASVGGRGELRFYKDADAVTNYSDPSGYVVMNREIGTQMQGTADEAKPFALVTQNGASFLSIAMRIENQNYNRALATRQAQEFNTFLRVDSVVRPRNFL
jgi:type II secretory pathway pseudopilin PulG